MSSPPLPGRRERKESRQLANIQRIDAVTIYMETPDVLAAWYDHFALFRDPEGNHIELWSA